MFSLRRLRIKAMQYLFAFFMQRKAMGEEVQPFVLTAKEKRRIRKSIQTSMAAIHELHAYFLQLMDAWANIEKERADGMVIRPATPLSDDSLLSALRRDPNFICLCETHAFPIDLLERWYDSYLTHPYAKQQASNTLMEHLVKYFFKAKEIQAECERRYLYWHEDKSIVYQRLRHFIDLFPNAVDQSFALYDERLPQDKEDFYVQLVQQTLESIQQHDEQLMAVVQNWSFERINPLDQTLIRMTLTEITQFPNIPTKVSINEYLEIAKEYSTPKSSAFINGVADRITKLTPNF